MADPYTMELRLCDDAGMVSHRRVEDTIGEPREFTYLDRLNHLRWLTLARLEGEAFKPTTKAIVCTGNAHLAGEHIRCTCAVHFVPPDRDISQPLVLQGEAADRAREILERRS
jgi:hypothetical protein